MCDCLHLGGSDCSPCVLLLLLFLPLPVLGPAAAVGGCGHTTDVSASDLPREQQHARAQARATDGRCLPPFAAARHLLLRRLSTQLPVHMLTTGHLRVNRIRCDWDKERFSPFAAARHSFLRRLSGVPRCPSIC